MARCLDRDNYTVAWVAILPIEAQAALAALDRRHDGYFLTEEGDDYLYIGGDINGHNIVVATLPAGQNYGVGEAAALVSQVKARFEKVRFALLVGVAAGCPNLQTSMHDRQRDIRLGDVLVCVPYKAETGIVHYDLGQDTEEGFVTNGRQAEPPALVRSAIAQIQLTRDQPYREGNMLHRYVAALQASSRGKAFAYPGVDRDELFVNSSQTSGPPKLASRPARDPLEKTIVWYGNIGSGNSVMKNPQRRDELRDRYNLIGLEMEAAGVMNRLPTGVIRGVCDYGDGHKNKEWQGYAAAVAAAYAKGILYSIHFRSGRMSVVLAAPTNLFSNTSLRSQADGMYWEHLTVDSFSAYDRIWHSLSARYGQAIKFDALAQFLEVAMSTGVHTPASLRDHVRHTWDVLLDAWISYERPDLPDPDLVAFPENLIVGALYMIHMRIRFPFEAPNSRRDPSVIISPERWENLTRFNQWVSCACGDSRNQDCGREWNFARRGGLSRRYSHAPQSTAKSVKRRACILEDSARTKTSLLRFTRVDPTVIRETNKDKFYSFKQLPRTIDALWK